ncbi:hypothetical protein CMEL01_00269 [Colletotrichum melonis]|uniref:Uncharacterized protein n=1 Tax=Colletotrichum melonis TaxID=1209925 RepID=A0AAI9V498_9PEZI|nr:hypothetical protein CMEL01_00269 [Colletotrichum melonis]
MTSPSGLRHVPYTAESNGLSAPPSPIPSAVQHKQRTMARWRLDRQRPNRSWSLGRRLLSPESYVKWIGHNSQSNPSKASRSRRQIREEEEKKTLLDLFAGWGGGRRGEEEEGAKPKAKTKGPEGWETQRHRNTVCEASECQPGLLLTWRDRSQLPTPPALR